METVSVRPPFGVALAVVGDEIARPGSKRQDECVEELSLGWLGAAIESLGLETLSLGVRPDTAESLRDAILHLRGRAEVLLLVGGASDGVTDRTLESLIRFDSQLVFHGVDLDGAASLGHAKSLGIDVLAIGGKPLESAALWDLFLRPALLACLGASPDHWDWSRGGLAIDLSPDPGGPRAQPGSVSPAARARGPDGALVIRALSPDAVSPFLPVAPPQEGWLIWPRGSASHGGLAAGMGYFQPLSPSGRPI